MSPHDFYYVGCRQRQLMFLSLLNFTIFKIIWLLVKLVFCTIYDSVVHLQFGSGSDEYFVDI